MSRLSLPLNQRPLICRNRPVGQVVLPVQPMFVTAEPVADIDISTLSKKDLISKANELGIDPAKMKKAELMAAIESWETNPGQSQSKITIPDVESFEV